MTYKGNVVSIALTASAISILARETLTLPMRPTLSTRAKKRNTEGYQIDKRNSLRNIENFTEI